MPEKAFELRCDGEPADDIYPDVEFVEVDENLTATTFLLRLRLRPQPDGEWSHLDDSRFTPFSRIAVAMGFTGGGGALAAVGSLLGGGGGGGLEPLVDGYVTGVTLRLGSQAADAFLEVTGMDAMVLLGVEEKTLAWPDMSDADIVAQVMAGYGITAETTPTSPVHQEDDTLVLQRGTDAQLVRALARRNGYEAYVSRRSADADVTCYFGPPRLDGAPGPDLAIRFGEQSNLHSFDVALSGLRPLTVRATQVDALTKEEAAADVSDSDLQALGATDLAALVSAKLGSLVTPQGGQGQMLLAATPSADPAELRAVAQAVRDDASWLTFARGEVNCDAYGSVLRAGRLVLVKGAGSPHSGKYYVTRVVHRMSPDGTFTESFEARRNARDLDGSESFGGGPAGGLGVPSL